MALTLAPIQGPGVGIRFMPQDAVMTLDTGLTCALGDVLAVKMETVNSFGERYVVRQPATADFSPSSGTYTVTWFCVALEAQSTAAGNVKCRFVGTVDALVATTSLAIGSLLSPTNGNRKLTSMVSGLTTVDSGVRSVAVLRVATTGTDQIKSVDFDGINGFGQAIETT